MTQSRLQTALSKGKTVLINGIGFEKGTHVKSFTVGKNIISVETKNVRTFKIEALNGLLNKITIL